MGTRIELALADGPEDGFYVSERKVYPRSVSGRYQRLRAIAVFLLLGVFYGFPWLRWDGRQAVLFDLPARKFHIFALTFWPQDFPLLALLLIIAGVALFFFTALAGRLWCGYACPQTVWTEVFLWIERRIEGDRNARMRLDAAPWSARKLLRKGGKHAAWLVFAAWTGVTFTAFFTPAADLVARLHPFDWSGWEAFWVVFYGFATWGNAGFLREQVCKYMCPYARFQGAMFDRDTLLVAYDPMRGEPRGPRRRGLASVLERARGRLETSVAYDYMRRAAAFPSAAAANVLARGTITFEGEGADRVELKPLPKFAFEELGDCIDCTACVQVCPTGIDIRNGLQYECIACAACVDACDDVMAKLGMPGGLIRHTTQNALDGRRTRVLRPRIFVYAAILGTLVAIFAVGVGTLRPTIVEVLRDRNALYREAGDGIENGYTLKIANKDEQARRFTVRLASDTPMLALRPVASISVPGGEVASIPVIVVGPDGAAGRHEVRFEIRAADESEPIVVESSFFGPVAK